MSKKCAGCGSAVIPQDKNCGEFWYGVAEKNQHYTDFSVVADDQRVSIVGHQMLYFCPDCLRAAQQNCIEPQNALDQFAIALRRTSLGTRYHYFTRRDFARLQFT